MSVTAFKKLTNNAVSATATNLLATGVTSITLNSGDGAKFPATGSFRLDLWNGAAGSNPVGDANYEQVVASARSGDVITITATTKAHTGSCNVMLPQDAGDVSDTQTAVNNIENGTNLFPATSSAVGAMRQIVFNVKDYGAVGDGVTDDTTAIQATLTVASSGSAVWVPYTSSGYKCGAITIPIGVRLEFDQGAKFIAPSTLSTSWVKAVASVVHQGTSIIGGIFDATATTNTGVYAVIDFSSVTSCPNISIRNTRVINAPVHGITVSESTKTLAMKWVTNNSVEEHGVATIGFGIYADYIGNILIDGNYVYTAGVDDSIELGHSGIAWLGVNAHMRCTNNTVVGGQINYPFSDYVEIANNTVIGNTIQNDGNTANYPQIIANKVLGASPASSYAGISHWGSNGQIIGNHISVTTLNGIGGSWTKETVSNNVILTTSVSNSGYGIYPGGGGIEDVISGNFVSGNFNYGLYLPFAESVVTGNTFNTFNGLQYNGVQYTIISGNNFNVGNQPSVGTPGIGTVVQNNAQIAPVGTVLTPASITTAASLNIPSGVAPTSPNNGDTWYDGSHLKFRIAGTTYQLDQQVNLTGPITSVGNTTSIASQTGTGTIFAMSVSPTFTGTVTVPTPVNSTDASTKAYVDSVATGLDVKASVRALAISNITLSGTQTIDGIAVIAGDRVLATGQSTAANNGIYVVASGSWARSTDANMSAMVTSGMFTFVEEGTAYASMGFVLTTANPITLGTTGLAFTQFSGAGEITAGSGLTKTGNTLAIDTSIVARKADNLSVFAATTSAQLAGVLSDETGSGAAVFANSPVLVTPVLGTPASGVATNLTGTASGLTAGNVTTNANLTGPITSVGNATTITAVSVTNAMLAGSITAANLVGTDIATVGTITAGVWTGTTIAVANGGTGQTSYTNGQLLIGNTTGNTLAKATLTGTTNQVIVTNGAGTITLSTPQDINTTSAPSFAAITCSGTSSGSTLITFNLSNLAGAANSNTAISMRAGNLSTGRAQIIAEAPGSSNTYMSFWTSHNNAAPVKQLFIDDVGNLNPTDGTNLILGATTGMKFGTATSQKLGFFNATPIVQEANTIDLGVVLSDLGLRATGTAWPLTTTGNVSFGNVALGTAGNKLSVAAGTNASVGTGTLVAGTATISTTAVSANSLIFLQDTSTSITNVGVLTVSAKTAGTSFVVTSTLALDTSTFNWWIIN